MRASPLLCVLLVACAEVPPTLVKDARAPLPELAGRSRRVAALWRGGCAVTPDGLRCWGAVLDVPLGTVMDRPEWVGSHTPPLSPRLVPLPSRVVGVVASGQGHGCLRFVGGEVGCWGDNWDGSIGVGCSRELRRAPSPMRVPLPAGAMEVAVLGHSSCASLEDGTVWCWGHVHRAPGELPEGCLPRRITTEDGAPLRGVVRLEVGAAIDHDGAVWTWRDRSRSYEQMSLFVEEREPEVAMRVRGLPPAFEVAASWQWGFALTGKGELWRWPRGERGAVASRVEWDGLGRQMTCEHYGRCVVVDRDGEMWRREEGGSMHRAWRASPEEIAVSVRGGCLLQGGEVRCWGWGLIGATEELRDLPTRVPL